jgi:hypothetical protein
MSAGLLPLAGAVMDAAAMYLSILSEVGAHGWRELCRATAKR